MVARTIFKLNVLLTIIYLIGLIVRYIKKNKNQYSGQEWTSMDFYMKDVCVLNLAGSRNIQISINTGS